jgi:hypothetical protein
MHYTGANVFPDQPREQPNSKQTTEYWAEINGILDGHEYFGFMERGVTPPSFAKFDLVDESDLALLPVPGTDSASYTQIVRHNMGVSKTLRDNASRKSERASTAIALNRKLAAQVAAALRPNAPMVLLTLQTCHKIPQLLTSSYDRDDYDGVGMLRQWRELSGQESAVVELTSRWHEQQYEILRDTKLPDKCSSEDFSAKVTRLLRDHLPHFKTVRLEGEDLSRAIINFMPQQLAGFGVKLEESLTTSGDLGDPLIVIGRCEALVAGACDPIHETARLACAFRPISQTSVAPAMQATTPTYSQRQVDALVANAKGKATAAAKVETQSVETLAAAKVAAQTAREKSLAKRKEFTLPDGQWCADGTCHGKHGEKYPGDRKSTRLNSSHTRRSRMPSSA